MTTLSLPVQPSVAGSAASHAPDVALVGPPNVGKTRLFNALTGLRARTANFAGTTVEGLLGAATLAGRTIRLVDLPGLYGLDAVTPDERVAERVLRGAQPGWAAPRAVLLILDATHLERGLPLASQVLELGLPTVVALNLVDAAEHARIRVDADALAAELGVQVMLVSARTGAGIETLREALDAITASPSSACPGRAAVACGGCGGCPYSARYAWAERVAGDCARHPDAPRHRFTDAIDRVLTHPLLGVAAFIAVMLGVFYLIFALAELPMALLETAFATLGDAAAVMLPDGLLQGLVVDGVIAGVGGVLVFLPQIALLFFIITLLEDTGYLARAAFVMDRLMRRVGLPGKAFVPMLSAHACAVPAIMATRIIDDWRDRLVTILVLPLLTCSARLPVYAMVVALLFRDRPAAAALVFTGAYLLGIVAALGAALVFRKTLLKGQTRPLLIELPDYRLPSLRTAMLLTADRCRSFLRKAGTVILLISVVLWALASFPRLPAGVAADLAPAGDAAIAQAQLDHSIAGRLGRAVEPVFAPLGFNWQLNVGVLSSFAARETVVSTLGIVYGLEAPEGGDADASLAATLAAQTRPDGSPQFDLATCLSLLVFYVLAMQCLPTQVVTRRETGSWKWPLLQLAYMSLLAWCAATATYQLARGILQV